MSCEVSAFRLTIDIINCLAAVILALATTVGLLFIRQQIVELKVQRREEDSRSKAELAVDLIRSWASGTQRATYDAKRLVEENLTEADCKRLSAFKPFQINDADVRRDLTDMLKLSFPDLQTDRIFDADHWLQREYVIHIRWLCVSYLNLLESILAAWRHDAADKTIIFDEFRILYGEKAENFPFAVFRKTLPTNGYIAIEEFGEAVKKDVAEQKEKGRRQGTSDQSR